MTSRTQLLYSLAGAVSLTLLTRLQLVGTGNESEIYRYFLSIILGGITGFILAGYRQTVLEKSHTILQTQKKLAEESQKNTRLFQHIKDIQSSHELILDSIGEGVYRVSHTGATTFINRAIIDSTGFDENHLLRENQHSLLHHTRVDGSPYPEESCPVHKTCMDGKIRKVEGEVFWRKDGSSFPVDYIVTPTNEFEGSYGAVVIFRDISRQVLIEEHLEASEEQFRTLFDTSTEAILIMDEQGRIINANPSTFRLFYCQDENHLLGKSLTDFCSVSQNGQSTSGESLSRLLADTLSQGSSFSEWELVREDFKTISAAVLLARMDLGSTVFIQANIRDISRQKLTELKLETVKKNLELKVNERTDELRYNYMEQEKELQTLRTSLLAAEKESIARNRFIMNFSSKMRPALQSIATLSRRISTDNLLQAQKSDLNSISHYTSRLLSLNTDTFDLSQLEAEQLKLISQTFNIRRSIQETIEEFRKQSSAKGLVLNCTFQSTIPPQLVGDSQRLQIVLSKLLENSIKFTKQGKIEVTVRLNRQIDERHMTISFYVRDTGPGIDTKKQNSINKILQRQSSLTEITQANTGLGLYLSSKLLKLMGGSMSLESHLGKGSEFCFTLPFIIPVKRKTDISEDTGINTSSAKLKKRTILVADDEFINRRMFSSILESHGADVRCAEDGNVAIKLFQREHFDCILMDVQMPHCDGFRAMQSIRKIELDQERKRTATIALSAHAIPEYKQKCQDAGMDTYITKPIDADLLLQSIDELLEISPSLA